MCIFFTHKLLLSRTHKYGITVLIIEACVVCYIYDLIFCLMMFYCRFSISLSVIEHFTLVHMSHSLAGGMGCCIKLPSINEHACTGRGAGGPTYSYPILPPTTIPLPTSYFPRPCRHVRVRWSRSPNTTQSIARLPNYSTVSASVHLHVDVQVVLFLDTFSL